MKMKSIAIFAISGLLAASCAYIAPAFADDTTPSAGQSMQMPADNNSSSSMPNQNSSAPPTAQGGGDMNNNNSSTTDEGSPDTATGDDDY